MTLVCLLVCSTLVQLPCFTSLVSIGQQGPVCSQALSAAAAAAQVPLGSFNGKILSVGGRADGADLSQ
jgi:hypothetical protein